MYERFTDRARKVMQLANQEAQRFKHEYVGTQDILLGLIKEGNGLAAHALKYLNVDLLKVCLEVEKIVKPGSTEVTMDKLEEYAFEECRLLNHNYVGTEHLLLGIVRDVDTAGAQVLMYLGLKLEDVRAEVLHLLGHNQR